MPAVTTVVALAHVRPCGTKLEQQVAGLPTGGFTSPVVAGRCTTWADTPLVWSVISVTIERRRRRPSVTLPTRPSPLITGWSTRTPSLEPLSIVDRRVPDGRRAADHARGDRLVAVDAAAELSSPTSARSCAFSRSRGLGAVDLRCAARRARLLQLVALGLGVERVAEPADEVADRLERAAGALLDRREHLHDAALDGVQRAAGATRRSRR